jgi:hypothetical protein
MRAGEPFSEFLLVDGPRAFAVGAEEEVSVGEEL